jgi:Mg2+ and Co2+ transporter CorA
MRIFHVGGGSFTELDRLPEALPAEGFLWLGSARAEFEAGLGSLQERLQRWTGGQLVDLHVSDLLNPQLPSQHDYTSWYDLLVFRRLAAGAGGGEAPEPSQGAPAGVQRTLETIDTNPVGFAVFDRVLVTVHPPDCLVREHFAQRLAGRGASELRTSARLPPSPADLMLRMVNHMVDGYLELRRLLTRQLGALQQEMFNPRSRFHDWPVLLEARNVLHVLDDTCEDQRSAIQEWIDALAEWPDDAEPRTPRERELLRVRSRDVLEHIERVLTHVRRLEQSAETAVQMHFSALGNRTNDIMRTLTVLTAVFLPLNLITGVFGMNFESLPLIHTETGFWVAMALMLAVGFGLIGFFWRQRYINHR